jgi:hypothetical protein
MIIFSLLTSIFSILSPLFISRITIVPAGHFIQETTSLREFFSVTVFDPTLSMISFHLSPAFSAGLHTIGDMILTTQGVCIST